MAEQSMTCAMIREAVRRGEVPNEAKHLATCAACQALVEGAETLSPYMSLESEMTGLDSTALQGRLHSALEAETGLRARARAMPTPTRLAILAVVTVAVVVAAGVLKPRGDMAVYPKVRMWLTVLSTLGVALAAGAISLRPIQQPSPRNASVWGITVVGVVLAVLPGLLPIAHTLTAKSVAGGGAELIPWAAMCWATGTALGLPVIVAFWILYRGVLPNWTPALLASLGAGMVGVTGLQLYCPVNLPAHLVLGHATVPLVLLSGVLLWLNIGPKRARG